MKPLTFWYGIVSALCNDKVKHAQLQFCQESMTSDNIEAANLLDIIKGQIKEVNHFNMGESASTYEYTCYLSFEDTSQTGGYAFPSHWLSKRVVCSPKYVISENGYQNLKNNGPIKCPHCCTVINESSFVNVKPHTNEILMNINDNKLEINEPKYNCSNFENVEVPSHFTEPMKDIKLKAMTECNFDVNGYNITAPYIQEPISSRFMEIKTQEEFNAHVYKRYPFLSSLDMTNACLAGGFCRSILLKQRMKDFDFFFIGEDPEKTLKR
jgi:hypothetical protein